MGDSYEEMKAFRWAQPGGHCHCATCKRPLAEGDAVRLVGHSLRHADCDAPRWDSPPSRSAVFAMSGETGRDPIESDPAWFCDLLTVDGADVMGYLGPEHEDVPPCCSAPVP